MNLMSKEKAIYFEPNFENLTPPEQSIITGVSEIDSLNLNRIIAKSMNKDSGYGWDFYDAEAISSMYRVFLFLSKLYPNQVIVPPREVDEFWHLHILDTRNYIKDCEKIFGSYFHHFPYAGLEGTKVSEAEELAFRIKTLELVKRHFPSLIEDELHVS